MSGNWGDIVIAFLLAFITAYVFTPYTIRLANRVGALDVPKDSRKVHKAPMPRLGGLAIILGFVVSIIYLFIVMSVENSLVFDGPDSYTTKLIGFFIGALVLGVFCFIDDLKGIPPYVKLIGQLLAAAIVTYSGIRIDKIIWLRWYY